MFLMTKCQPHVVQVKNINNGIELNSINQNIRIQFYNNDIVRIIKWPSKGRPDKKSLSVINKPNTDLEITISEANNKIDMTSSTLR
ncbi:MAG TPA: DUF4968 domain-containing protein, partial [Caldithrix sp.]|nr:DUF4968 domain-containing protein [Caldithrix sp.]